MTFEFKYNYPKIARESGFKLRQFREGSIDWHMIGTIEIDKILREQQFEGIDAVLLHLSEAPLAPILESNVLDGGIVKYFLLSQLAIQYLVFCRKFLDETVKKLRESLVSIDTENLSLRKSNHEQNNEIIRLHKKVDHIESVNNIVFPCHLCTKNFVSNDSLNIHLTRKHSKSPPSDVQTKESDQTLINIIKLELEIKQLKERLDSAEKEIRIRSVKATSPTVISKTESCTQTELIFVDVATQCEAEKTVVSDSHESSEDDLKNIYILSQIHDKILGLESWQKSYCSDYEQVLDNVSHKLTELLDVFKSRSDQEAKSLTAIMENIVQDTSKKDLPTNSLDELQVLISNLVTKGFHMNTEKLTEILEKVDYIYTDKISLKKEPQFVSKQIQVQRVSEPSPSVLLHTINEPRRRKEHTSSDHDSQTFNIEPMDPECSEIISNTNDTRSDEDDDTSKSQETSVDKSLPQSKRNQPLSISHSRAKKEAASVVLTNKMAMYGISPTSKTMSSAQAAKVFEELKAKRNALKKAYPNFTRTRKDLEDILNSRIVSRAQGSSHGSSNKNSKKLNYTRGQKDRDKFQQELDLILSSPIKKPMYVSSHNSKSSMKPTPNPRRHVVFEKIPQIAYRDSPSSYK